MGLIATLLKLTGSKLDTKGNSPGKSVIADGEGFDGQTIKAEVYQAPGVFGMPPDGVRAVWVPIGGTNRYGLVISVNNYQVEVDVGGKGGVALYSTTADGQTVKAKVICQPDGKIIITSDSIEINGDGKRLVTWSELNSALQNHVHSAGTHLIAPPSGGPCTGSTGAPVALDISAAKTTTLKTGG